MAAMPPDSNDLFDLPAVPRRPSVKAANSAARDTLAAKQGDSRDRSSSKDSSEQTERRRWESIRPAGKSGKDNDDEDDSFGSDRGSVGRRSGRLQRRASQSRKIMDEDDEDEADMEDAEDNVDDLGSDGSNSASPTETRRKRKASMKESTTDRSGSPSPSPAKKKKRSKSKSKSSASESTSKDGEEGTDGVDTGMEEVIPGQRDILAQLEKEAEDDDLDDFDSEDSDEREISKKPERLTRRQRAMAGEDVSLEFTKLESPKAKKKSAPTEDWSHDEEVELKRQQKARLRLVITEKRNKEKRAATVDKVLRGVTSKRKKLTMATEARAAQVGSRLSQNEMREGCIRFISNRDGVSLSLPKEVDEPAYLQVSMKASYPRVCKRDPRTGKRIFTEA